MSTAMHPTRSLPFCVNCKHLDNLTSPRHLLCGHPQTPVGLVTGEPDFIVSQCGQGRREDGWCKPEGSLFEPADVSTAALRSAP